MPSSLAIGDFSRATHLSVKTLRHYHRLGLLVPAEVDPDSSYRRYSTEQIPTAQVIRRFRISTCHWSRSGPSSRRPTSTPATS